MDLIKNKNTTATDIALAFNVPPELLGSGTKTFANYKEARQAFYEESILPTMDSLRDAFNMWLVPAFGEGLYLDYDRDDIEALVEKRESKYTSLEAVGFLNMNEKREAAGYDTKEGLDLWLVGGVLYTEDELAAIGTEDDTESEESSDSTPPPPPEDAPEDEDENEESSEDDEPTDDEDEDDGKEKSQFKSINLLNANEKRKSWARQNKIRLYLSKNFDMDLRKQFSKLITDLSKTAKDVERSEPKVIEFALLKTIDEWAPNLKSVMAEHIESSLDLFTQQTIGNAKHAGISIEKKQDLYYDQFVTDYIEQRTGNNIKTILNTSQKQVKRIVGEWVQEAITAGDSIPELSGFIEKEFEGLTKSNSNRIARTEVALASNNGALEAVKSLDVPTMYKEWVSANDSRVRDGTVGYGADHLHVSDENGEIPIDDYFKVNPDVMMQGPGDPGAPADQVINCRCVLVFKNKAAQ